MIEFYKDIVKKQLKDNGIDICSKDYEKSEAYINIKNNMIFSSDGGISLEEFIERYLLDEQAQMHYYKSIYSLGNHEELFDDSCSDIGVAEEINSVLNLANENNAEDEAVELVKKLYRKGGLISRLKKFLNIDLESFDKSNKQFNLERYKILYFFYILEYNEDKKTDKKTNKKTNILMMLGKPSMENIDNWFLKTKTYNGELVGSIKESFGKDLSLPIKRYIELSVHNITTEWNIILNNASLLMDFLFEHGYEYDFAETIYPLISEEKIENTTKNVYSPIETLYLKLIQNEVLGNIIDIDKINSIQIELNYNVPIEFIDEMKKFNECHVEINSVEKYINENALRIAKYVYLREANGYEVEKIQSSAGKVLILIDFLKRVNPIVDIKQIITELQIISCLQVIVLGDKSEILDYTFHGYENHMKHKPRVQAALKRKQKEGNKPVVDALKVYLGRKVADHWYANMGRYDARIQVRELEKVCDRIMEEALTQLNLDGMLNIHSNYLMKVDDRLLTTKEQIYAVKKFEHFLHSKGFKYIDRGYQIRYAFLFPNKIMKTHENLIYLIGLALEDGKALLQVTFEASGANGNQLYEIDFALLFDYQSKECIMNDFKRYPK